MLEAVGGECAGALSLYSEGQQPDKKSEDMEVLDEQSLSEVLGLLNSRPLMAGTDDVRLSLAGAQDKLAVGVEDDQILLLKGNQPTTHIIKPMIADIGESVHNEFFCMQLANAVGIEAPKTEIRHAKGQPYFIIERYDRVREAGMVKRLHQEDFCQALGIMPEHKYEREGGPSAKACLDLLYSHSAQPAKDRLALLTRLVFNYIIGNADAHGKNFSFLYRQERPQLSPAYDVLSTAVYPGLSNKMAMKIGSQYEAERVLRRHWYRLVPDTKFAQKNIDKLMSKIAEACVKQSQRLKAKMEGSSLSAQVYQDIDQLIQQRAERIMSG